ncbi:hypothetical protein CLHUN_33210 [Ruminiclostridium hungatei]|uniref:Uncharacterized protein n=1 Tax=Ruminiclostridium hungatei TaxID=48256 RepID=A0A1V4SHX9_RUMHU|nr:hypothetical protein CLHUN_33210 [Ruminiclostridium hungatei]
MRQYCLTQLNVKKQWITKPELLNISVQNLLTWASTILLNWKLDTKFLFEIVESSLKTSLINPYKMDFVQHKYFYRQSDRMSL